MRKKKKNGFTLLELMAVVIVLAVMALIVTPLVINSIKKSREDLYDIQIENIKSAAKSYMIDLDLSSGDKLTLTLDVLKKSGHVDKEITNPITGEKFDDCLIVEVSKIGDLYEYEVSDNTLNSCNSESVYRMVLLGSIEEKTVKNEIYKEPGIIIEDQNGKRIGLDNVKVDIKQNGVEIYKDEDYNNLSSLIDTSDYYQYEIVYKYEVNNDEIISVSRKVFVVDKNNLSCVIATSNTNENGWVTSDRNAKIVVGNTNDKNIKYSISTSNVRNYTDDNSMTLENDGTYKIYGYVKDSNGNESACVNSGETFKYEVSEPTCNITFDGPTKNGWYIDDIRADLIIEETSPTVGYDLTLVNNPTYNGKRNITVTSSSKVYGYVKDEAGKTISCNKKVVIDRDAPVITSFTATTNSSNVITLVAVATDNDGSGIKQYDFYNGTTLIESIKTSEESASTTYTSSYQGNLSFKVVVTDNIDKSSEKPLVESCSVSSSSSCSSGEKTAYVECEGTGRKYSYRTSVGCPCDNYTSSSSCSTYCSGYGYEYGSRTAVYNCRGEFQYYSSSCNASCPTTTTTRTTTTTTRATTTTTTTRTTTTTTTTTTNSPPTTTVCQPTTSYSSCSVTCSNGQVLTGRRKITNKCDGKTTKGSCSVSSSDCPTTTTTTTTKTTCNGRKCESLIVTPGGDSGSSSGGSSDSSGGSSCGQDRWTECTYCCDNGKGANKGHKYCWVATGGCPTMVVGNYSPYCYCQ